jgi:hypothetical protein
MKAREEANQAHAMSLDLLGLGYWAAEIGPLPTTTLLPPAERRRAPTTVLMALAAAEQACAQAGLAPSALPSVFASAHGDLAITDYLCRTLAESPEHLSPTKFHNSVHNAPSGYWTISTGCTHASTAMSASSHTWANGLLEAATQAMCSGGPVLLVAYDMAASGALACVTPTDAPLSVALVLAPSSVKLKHRDGNSPPLARLRLSLEPQALLTAASSSHSPRPLLAALAHAQPPSLTTMDWPLSPQLCLRLAVASETSASA